MDGEKHACLLGKLLHNLLELEFILRSVLHNHDSNEPCIDIDAIKVGDSVPVNSFTKGNSLDSVINSYNRITGKNSIYRVDKEVVTLRNSIAHGRLSGKTSNVPFELIKFSRQKDSDGRITIENIDVLDLNWFSAKIRFVGEQIRKAKRFANTCGIIVIK